MIYLSGDRRYSLAVVGESHYQDALIAIAGPYSEEGRSMRCYAVLDPEEDNPHDPNAVRVEIGGDTVGYIARDDAPFVRMLLIGRSDRCYVDAMVRGGRTGQQFGVWLDLPLDVSGSDDGEELVQVMEPDLVYMPGIGLVTDYFPRYVPKSQAPVIEPTAQARQVMTTKTSMPWWGYVILLIGPVSFLLWLLLWSRVSG